MLCGRTHLYSGKGERSLLVEGCDRYEPVCQLLGGRSGATKVSAINAEAIAFHSEA